GALGARRHEPFQRTRPGSRSSGRLPAFHQVRTQHAMRRIGPAEVVQRRMKRVRGVGGEKALLVCGMGGGFLRSEETRAENRAVSAERESRGETAAIGKAARSKQR